MPQVAMKLEDQEKSWLRKANLDDAVGHGLTEKEFSHIQEVLGRQLNLVELGICAALFSEHCSYKSTKVHLKNLPTEGPRVIQGPGENAGVVDIGDNQAVVFKIESHNHPTFIEPFQGAATGVGGILRDVFTMGARTIAVMNALRFGAPENIRTKYLLGRAVEGIGFYGNCMGIPTIGGELFFHESYNGNCLVNAFALGLVDQDKVFYGKAAGIGNAIFYVGSKTGRDGIHGATMASAEFDDNSQEKRPTVQVGDPFQEKLLLEACLEVMATGAVIGIQDMGAAGLTSSTYEMAERAGTGVRIHLDRVPQRETNMNPYEIMLSESQERMLVVISRGQEAKVLEIFKRWDLDAVEIGEVVEGRDVELYWHGELVSAMPASVVTSSVPQYRWPEAQPKDFDQRLSYPLDAVEEPKDLAAVWLKLIGSPNLCSRYPVYRQYDSTVRSNTVIHPGGDAGVIRIKNPGGREKGVAMTLDCNCRFTSIDPRQGTALSLAEACRNIAAVGAQPIAISDCLNFGSPEKPEGMWEIAEAIRGLGDSARAFEVPIVSGNVSLYNETKGRSILPTPMIALVGLIQDASKCQTVNFKSPGDRILVLGETREREIGGSEYLAAVFGIEMGPLPRLDYDLEIKSANLVRELIELGLIRSCHDISAGGLAVALAECCFSLHSSIGASISVEEYSGRKDGLLFAESGARYIVSCTAAKEQEIRKLASSRGVSISLAGTVGGERIEVKGFGAVPLKEAYACWRDGLKGLID